ncbi:scavenger receptor cysteine-rich domain-containing protein DMBT1-like isoform X3 [Narcine bancroftii]|uniref:scavenger receptor cysteine-rich domain-containing protein DMBT1-like isoform X3 n=1 Tax=Narcine bancroftii TaxID=1343680 RepID=UPI003831F49D
MPCNFLSTDAAQLDLQITSACWQRLHSFGELRMVGPLEPCVGDLLVKYRDQWMPVCSTQWTARYGEIVCRETGCGLYDILQFKPVSAEYGPLLLNTFQCNGTETSFTECSFTVSNQEQCQSGAMVNIYCKVKQRVELSDGGSPCAGRVEASNSHSYLLIVCGRGWDMNEAQVLCNYLGCGDAVSASGNSEFGTGKWPMLHAELHCNGTENDPWKCERRSLAHSNCSKEIEAAGVTCSGHRKPRLVDGSDRCSGRLEIQHGETWGTMCDSHWDLLDARVVCTALKCGDVISVIGGAYFGEGSGPMWKDSYECEGNESMISDCATTTQRHDHNCTRRSSVSIICSGQKGPRLVGGNDACSGRVEILRGEIWGTICDAFWDLQDASVVCNNLRCGVALSAPGGAFFGEGNGTNWNDVYECRGNEKRLSDCHIASWTDHPCTHRNDAGVLCSADRWQLRLVDGAGVCDGRVEVYNGGVWGRVTDDLWDFKDADVVCRQLNCGSAINVYNSSIYGIGKGSVLMNNVNCTGSEPSIWNCTFTQPKGLSLGDDVGVFCSDHSPIRLMDGGNRCAGRVELYYNGTWGTVCDDSWDLTDALVICKELNCGSAVNATVSSWFGQGSGPIWMDDVNCSANDSALWQCLARPRGENDCIHKEDAGVICSDYMAIRLVNGTNPCQGRLEVFHNNIWGTVCSDSFNMVNAKVVCMQLNCGSATKVNINAAFGEGSGPIWFDEVKCRLDDTLLWQCPSSPWGQHNCNHREDVGVTCSESKPTKSQDEGIGKESIVHQIPKDADLRLVAGFDQCSGRVDVFVNGTWGTVCDDSWDSQDAEVVCRQLNCGEPVVTPAGMLFAQGNGTIWMDEVKCKGSELLLWDCQFPAFGRHDCGHKEDVGLICSGYPLHTAPFSYVKTTIYIIPCVLGCLLVAVSFYLVRDLIRNIQNGRSKQQQSTTGFPGPLYEDIDIQASEDGFVDSHSASSMNKVEYYVGNDWLEHKDELLAGSLSPPDDEYNDIEP